jgi:hypothetical protein
MAKYLLPALIIRTNYFTDDNDQTVADPSKRRAIVSSERHLYRIRAWYTDSRLATTQTLQRASNTVDRQ